MKKIWNWIKKQFQNADKNLLKTVVNITKLLKDGLNAGFLDILVSLTKTDIDNKILNELRIKVNLILAEELLIQDAANATTEADFQAIAKQVLDSFGKLSDEKKEEFYTAVAAKIFIFVKAHSHGEKITFGQAAQLVEAAYQLYIASKELHKHNY